MIFYMNGLRWVVEYVHPTDPRLVDRTGYLTVATTDPANLHIYISLNLHGEFLARVIRHELAHCVMVSYNLLNDIHRMIIPKYRQFYEEWLCNFIADHNDEINRLENDILHY